MRASPPPATTREAIKGGGFDAVLFTSSSTVRNLVGIAGKPHNVTVIACIGPATAKTAEEHGLRVDVMAPEPSVLKLAEALADFGLRHKEAAAGATTALTALRTRPPCNPVSVRGGSGGVGSVAVQVGKLLGAQVVALAGGRNLDFVRGLGAEEALDHRRTPPAALSGPASR
ncbi:hypothetical protein SVIOM342S_04372 [Streptomyces violaceorubidus]